MRREKIEVKYLAFRFTCGIRSIWIIRVNDRWGLLV